jgi:hypothetical protein
MVRIIDYSSQDTYGSRFVAVYVPVGTIADCSVIANLLRHD